MLTNVALALLIASDLSMWLTLAFPIWVTPCAGSNPPPATEIDAAQWLFLKLVADVCPICARSADPV
jgi:hypothetical protein